ncbi:hypothetical protein [Rhizobium vallis]|uniref:hypothetical protein n=1 Tax=Rhizobium vallis TaxID=634290 RepID=UPI000F88BA95|nr:hypothetical protein [Rhizobium vallis]
MTRLQNDRAWSSSTSASIRRPGAGLDQITLEELEAITYDENARACCSHCDEPRDDDTPATRFNLLLAEVIELQGKIAP